MFPVSQSISGAPSQSASKPSHGSDAPETAQVEVAFFFPGLDIHSR